MSESSKRHSKLLSLIFILNWFVFVTRKPKVKWSRTKVRDTASFYEVNTLCIAKRWGIIKAIPGSRIAKILLELFVSGQISCKKKRLGCVLRLCSLRKQPTFREVATWTLAKRRLSNECRNSTLMTCTTQILVVLLVGWRKISLRSKRFRKVFRTLEAFFVF